MINTFGIAKIFVLEFSKIAGLNLTMNQINDFTQSIEAILINLLEAGQAK